MISSPAPPRSGATAKGAPSGVWSVGLCWFLFFFGGLDLRQATFFVSLISGKPGTRNKEKTNKSATGTSEEKRNAPNATPKFQQPHGRPGCFFLFPPPGSAERRAPGALGRAPRFDLKSGSEAQLASSKAPPCARRGEAGGETGGVAQDGTGSHTGGGGGVWGGGGG